jgi:metal-responsive CopG/Arc/MetJ family transcriptional regulator
VSQAKVAITVEEGVLARVDALVMRKVFSNRGRAIQEAIQEELERMKRSRPVEECAKLDPASSSLQVVMPVMRRLSARG